MAKGFSKQLSSLAFSLQKTYEKIITAKPSLFVVAISVVAVSLFLLGGGIYDILIQPIVAIVASGGRIISFYPYGITEQLLLESVIIMVFYAMGFTGFIIAYRSTKYAYSPRQAYRFLLVGCVLLLISYVLVEQNLIASFS
ncbi:hypothetical protein GH146_02045 [archaeon]|nr:hypothetical protein [archaeon]TET24195.1 MAG: hypothetical protein E3J73_08710 [Candidatus Bathyarchaeum sp.]